MSLEQVRQRIDEGLYGPIHDICLGLLDALVERPPEQAERLTFNLLGGWVDRPAQDSVLQAAIAALCQMEGHPLELYFVFVDRREDREVEVPNSYVTEALAEGFFVDPTTGEEVSNFEDQIVPVFRAAQSIREYMSGSR